MRTILPEHKNPALREIAREVPVRDIRSVAVKKLIAEMKSLLAKEQYGVALAASQLGVPLRLFIVSGRALARGGRNAPDESSEASAKEDKLTPPLPDQVYINPVVLKMSRTKKEKHEGCLSVRGKWGIVPRAEKTMVSAYDEEGQKMTRGASGFLAHVFQHEMDHLDGILYTDKAAALYDDKPEKK
ncbi:peptide deformylase [Candidatus Kaiserbacteria bacterium]|nr:peptide deformylase [Candidatus Kaiserbacteria bacterium]